MIFTCQTSILLAMASSQALMLVPKSILYRKKCFSISYVLFSEADAFDIFHSFLRVFSFDFQPCWNMFTNG